MEIITYSIEVLISLIPLFLFYYFEILFLKYLYYYYKNKYKNSKIKKNITLKGLNNKTYKIFIVLFFIFLIIQILFINNFLIININGDINIFKIILFGFNNHFPVTNLILIKYYSIHIRNLKKENNLFLNEKFDNSFKKPLIKYLIIFYLIEYIYFLSTTQYLGLIVPITHNIFFLNIIIFNYTFIDFYMFAILKIIKNGEDLNKFRKEVKLLVYTTLFLNLLLQIFYYSFLFYNIYTFLLKYSFYQNIFNLGAIWGIALINFIISGLFGYRLIKNLKKFELK